MTVYKEVRCVIILMNSYSLSRLIKLPVYSSTHTKIFTCDLQNDQEVLCFICFPLYNPRTNFYKELRILLVFLFIHLFKYS